MHQLEAAIEFCNSPDCCELPGTGGAGGSIGRCDWTGTELCATFCEVQGSPVEACEVVFRRCLNADLGANQCEKCSVIALTECVELGGN